MQAAMAQNEVKFLMPEMLTSIKRIRKSDVTSFLFSWFPHIHSVRQGTGRTLKGQLISGVPKLEMQALWL